SNVRNVTQSVNATCPIYNGCNVIGTGTLAQAQASVDGGASGASGGSASSGGTLSGSGSGGTTPNKASNGGGSSSSGCAASAQGTPGGGAAFGALAGMLGLVIGRVIRVRRRAKSKG
ncbi:MAG TPA: hypothetical protein VK762_12455, partial [Polyangiaceae bacterium]|nr:hypothetical protein [Polyangiaceae bacterium]